MKTRVIGLGNTLLTDDGAGVYVAREVARRLKSGGAECAADVIETETAGFALMELMAGWDRVILVDCIQFDGVAPASVVRLDPQDLHTSLRIQSVHEIDLPTVLELGRRLGLEMPRKVIVYGVQGCNPHSLGEGLTEAGERGVAAATKLVLQDLGADQGISAEHSP